MKNIENRCNEKLLEELRTLILKAECNQKTDSTYEDQIHELDWRFDELLQDAESTLQDYKEAGLTYGSLDAEGYYRGVLTATNLFKAWTKDE